MHPILAQIADVFETRGTDRYGSEQVTQLQHALQCARLAEIDGAPSELVTAALLHDIGHLLHTETAAAESLDDAHEEMGYLWLLEAFGPAVADPVRLHVLAKRYLCTVDPSYEKQLSPTSHQSFLDQGGPMDEEELEDFEAETYHLEALRLRKWDDQAKDPERAMKPLAYFLPHAESSLA